MPRAHHSRDGILCVAQAEAASAKALVGRSVLAGPSGRLGVVQGYDAPSKQYMVLLEGPSNVHPM